MPQGLQALAALLVLLPGFVSARIARIMSGRSTSGVNLLNLDPDDKVAAAVVIPPGRESLAGKWDAFAVDFVHQIFRI